MKIQVLIGVMVFGALFLTKASADTPALPYDYEKVSQGGDYHFVMLAPASEFGRKEDASLRGSYGQSGLYRNEDSATPLWTIDWYAFEVFVSSDGRHLVRMGPWPSDPEELALAFYRDGEELKRYRISELVKNPEVLPHSISHFEWRGDVLFDDSQSRLTVNTLAGETYVFDVTSGEVAV